MTNLVRRVLAAFLVGGNCAGIEDCEGFLIAQFQQLDLSRMDFSEVYAEFVDAAKLPDEIEMSLQIQKKIETYYNNGVN